MNSPILQLFACFTKSCQEPNFFTEAGWQLFDNAVNWAIGTGAGGDSPFEITVALSHDTGDDAGDLITSDPTIAGQLNDTTGLTQFEARLGESGAYTDILAELQADGSFVLDLADLEALNGGLLGSGDYTLQLRAGNAVGVSDPASLDFTYEPDTESMGLSQETINLALSEFGFDLATVNFSTIVLEDATVVVRTEDNRDIVLPRYGRPSSGGGGGSFGGFGGGYGGGSSGFSPWIGLNYGSSGSGSPSNPGDPTPPPEEGIYIQSIDGNGFRVIYDRVDLAGDTFVHKPKTIETAFGNVNFFYHDQADSAQGIAKGDFSYTDDPEVFEVLLAAVGAQSVDDLSDIFVTGPFTQSEALAKEEAERVKTISDLWSRLGYIGILPNLGIQDLNLTPEKRKQLLDFEENLLKATALTDEFTGFGREEDALLLGEMTQLARVYAALDPQLAESSTGGGTDPAPNESPDVLFLRASGFDGPNNLQDDFDLVEARLDSLGFNVTVKNPTNFLRSDAEGMELIVTTGGLYADKTQFDNLDVPIVALHNYMFDELGFVSDYDGSSSIRASSGAISFDNASHLLSNNLSGNINLFNTSTSFALYTPGTEAIKIGTKATTSGTYSPIFAYEKGATLANGDMAAERRVSFIGAPDSISKLNNTGWSLFDAAISWAAGLEEETDSEEIIIPSQSLTSFLSTFWDKDVKEAKFQKGTNLLDGYFNYFDTSKNYQDSIDFTKKLLISVANLDADRNVIKSKSKVDEILLLGADIIGNQDALLEITGSKVESDALDGIAYKALSQTLMKSDFIDPNSELAWLTAIVYAESLSDNIDDSTFEQFAENINIARTITYSSSIIGSNINGSLGANKYSYADEFGYPLADSIIKGVVSGNGADLRRYESYQSDFYDEFMMSLEEGFEEEKLEMADLALEAAMLALPTGLNKGRSTREGNSGRLTIDCFNTSKGNLVIVDMFLYYDLIRSWFAEFQMANGGAFAVTDFLPLPRRSMSKTIPLDNSVSWIQISSAFAFGFLGTHYMASPELPLLVDCP